MPSIIYRVKSNLLYKAYKYLHALSFNFPPHFLITHRWFPMHRGITQLLNTHGLSYRHPLRMLFWLKWPLFSQLGLLFLVCLTHTHVKHHFSLEDFPLISLHPSLKQSLPPVDSLRVLSLHSLQNSITCICLLRARTDPPHLSVLVT